MSDPHRLSVEERTAHDLVRRYRQVAAPEPPRALDRDVLRVARGANPRTHWLPLVFATGVVLTLGIIVTVALTPAHHGRNDVRPQFVRAAARAEVTAHSRDPRQARLYSSDPPQRHDPRVWLNEIDDLRHAGRNAEADAEMRSFVRVNPNYDLGTEH